MILAEELNPAIDIADLISETQEINWNGPTGRTKSPHGSNPTAVAVYRETNRFYDFRDGRGGGPVDWVMHRDSLSFTAACDALAAAHGLQQSPTFSQRRESLKLAQNEMRGFSRFLWLKRGYLLDAIRRLRINREAAVFFIGTLDSLECDEVEERRSITAEAAAQGESVDIAGSRILASQIRDQLSNLHAAVVDANEQIDALERQLDRIDFQPESEVDEFLRKYYAVPALREELSA